jgi:hypothetical protein
MANYDAEIVAYSVILYSHWIIGTESVPAWVKLKANSVDKDTGAVTAHWELDCRFRPDAAGLLSPDIHPPASPESVGRVFFQKHLREMPIMIDLLRNEKPIWVHLNADRKIVVLFTGEEPVGEGELLVAQS